MRAMCVDYPCHFSNILITHWNDNHDDVDDGKSGQSGGNDRRGSFLTQGVGPREGAW